MQSLYLWLSGVGFGVMFANVYWIARIWWENRKNEHKS